VTNARDLEYLNTSARTMLYLETDRLLDGFHSLGWIKMTKDGDIEPSESILKFQKALGLSLTQLAPYGADSVIANPLFGYPSISPVPADVFVMMPFTKELQPVYEDHIRVVAEKLGVAVVRADDFFAANSIISDVWNAIYQAKVLIADCTSRNPNVFYELGIAHTLGKRVILIAQNKEDIPFDIQHMRAILYEFTPRGMVSFESALVETLASELTETQTIDEML
jgi:hypothetical protein